MRKNVLQYDDVMNTQREIIYKQRREVLDGNNLKNNIENMYNSVAEEVVSTYFADEIVNKESLLQEIRTIFGINELNSLKQEHLKEKDVLEELKEKASKKYAEKEESFGEEHLRELERVVMLKVVDNKWIDHIDAMDELKDGIGLRAYGQKNPIDQYRIEGFDMFDEMINDIKIDVVKILMNVEKAENLRRETTIQITGAAQETLNSINIESSKPLPDSGINHEPIVNHGPKVGRNDLCPCGSGKKYKNCCGK